MRLDDVTRNYDRVAKYYDRLTDVVFGWGLRLGRYRRRTVELLGDLEGAVVLDVGCGTGRNFDLLVPRVGSRGRVVGLDYSGGMLNEARERIRKHGWRNVETIRGDAATLERVPEPVDAVISVWCYGIVHDLAPALARAVDVLRPGGRIAIMDFGRSRPDRGPLRWLFPVYSRILNRLGISAAEDLDDQKLRSKWEQGRQLLETLLTDFTEDSYLGGAGIIMSGKKPETAVREPS